MLAVLDVNTRSIPLDNLSVFVTYGDFVVQHPAIFAVGTADTSFVKEGFSAGQGRAPHFDDSFDIIGMDRRGPLPALQIFERLPDVLEPALIEKIEVAVRQTGVDEGGSRIDEELKVRGRPGAIGVVGGGSHAAHYILFFAVFVSIRV